MIFAKKIFFSIKISFFFKESYVFKINICIPFQKNLILLKKFHSVKMFILFKQTLSVKDGFYFQFSLATNEQV